MSLLESLNVIGDSLGFDYLTLVAIREYSDGESELCYLPEGKVKFTVIFSYIYRGRYLFKILYGDII